MGQTVTIRLSERVSRSASYLAVQTDRRMEEVLAEWLDQAAVELPVEFLPDAEVLTLCDLQMVPTQQTELASLLYEDREGTLDDGGRVRLDELMKIYRRGLVRKARALKVAVQRGLMPPLDREI